jgi:hypothetical protein
MSRSLDATSRTCHWAHIAGPLGSRRHARSTVWICEYPYPTMRDEGPSEDCEGCPTWEKMQRARRDAEADAPVPVIALVPQR